MKWIKYLKCTQSTHTHKKKSRLRYTEAKSLSFLASIHKIFPMIFHTYLTVSHLKFHCRYALSLFWAGKITKKKKHENFFSPFSFYPCECIFDVLLSQNFHCWLHLIGQKKKHEMERFRGRRPADLKALHHIFIRSHSNYLCSVSCSHYPFSLLLTHERYFIYGEMRLGFFENQNKRLRLKTCLIIKKPI